MSAILKAAKTSRLSVELATDPKTVNESLELRYRIFVEELGADLNSDEAIDQDRSASRHARASPLDRG